MEVPNECLRTPWHADRSCMEDDQKASVDRLNELEYSEVFATFAKTTTEYTAMFSLVKPIIDGFSEKGLHLMSIGAGIGFFEDALIKNSGLSIDYFYAIEPNEDHLKQLEGTVAQWKIKYTIDKTYFTPEINMVERFDLIFMSHCLYYIPNPVEAMLCARSFLKPNGKVVIFHQTERGVCEIVRKFLSLASVKSAPFNNNDHIISSKDLTDGLVQKGISYYIKEEPSYLEVSDFIMKREIHSASHVISFMLQSWYDKLPESIQSEIYKMVEERCINPEPGKYLFSHPSAMIVIENK